VRQAAAALSICRLYIGNDTGTMHLAAAVGTKCIAIFSARHFPECWYPYGLGHIVLRRRVPCEGCTVFECNEHDNLCLKLIQVKDVIDAVEKILVNSA
jgi:ADP-heptose:LPS heptosyltransferase